MDKEFSRARLLGLLRPGDTVATFVQDAHGGENPLTWVRVIISAGMNGNPGPSDISALVAPVIGMNYRKRRIPGVTVDEVGTDPGALVVIEMGRALWPDGWECLGGDCPSAEHYGSAGQAPRKRGLIHHDVRALRHNRL